MKRFILDICLINIVTLIGVYLANKFIDFITIRTIEEYMFAQIGLLIFIAISILSTHSTGSFVSQSRANRVAIGFMDNKASLSSSNNYNMSRALSGVRVLQALCVPIIIWLLISFF
ncbi:hypothetical protein KO489_10045 [Reinekea forsetii]|nr:hypothetical protein [Reinekea forsetii]